MIQTREIDLRILIYSAFEQYFVCVSRLLKKEGQYQLGKNKKKIYQIFLFIQKISFLFDNITNVGNNLCELFMYCYYFADC